MKYIASVFVICAAALLASCGNDAGSGPTTVSQGPTARTIAQDTRLIGAPVDDTVYFVVIPVTESASGRWEATVDWKAATNELWMWVADGACSAEKFAQPECPFETACPCQFAVRSETATPKPRVLTIPSASGGTRNLIVVNLGPGEESVSYTVKLSSTSLQSGNGVGANTSPAATFGRKSISREGK